MYRPLQLGGALAARQDRNFPDTALEGAQGAGDFADALAGQVLERTSLENLSGAFGNFFQADFGAPLLGFGGDAVGGVLDGFARRHHAVGGARDFIADRVQVLQG